MNLSPYKTAALRSTFVFVVAAMAMYSITVFGPTVTTKTSLNAVNGGFTESTIAYETNSANTRQQIAIIGLIAIICIFGNAVRVDIKNKKQETEG